MNAKGGNRVKREVARTGNRYTGRVQTFGATIREALIPSRFPDEKAAAEGLGLVQSTFHRWINGKRVPNERDAIDLINKAGFTDKKQVDQMMDLWAIAHAPTESQPRLLRIYERAHLLEQELATIKARLKAR